MLVLLSLRLSAQDIAAQNVLTLDEKPTDVFFQLGGSGRLRYENLFNAASGRAFVGDSDSNVNDQMGFWLRLNKGEYFQSYFNLIHVNNWGRQSLAVGDSSPGQRDSFSANNGLYVNQAWGKWKFSDTIRIEFGRLPLNWGYGALFSKNSWQNHPFAFDSFVLGFDWEILTLSIVGIKAEQLIATGKDPEKNHYMLNFDFKNVMDYFKTINFAFMQTSQDEGSLDGGTTLIYKASSQRFSFETVGQSNGFGHKAAINYVSGKQTDTSDKTVKALMLDTELNYTFMELYNWKIWFGYHRDSGDDDLTDGTIKTYDPLYYDIHNNAGRMDFLKWGNLKYYRFGFSVDVLPHWQIGSEFLSFEKASSVDVVNFANNGKYFTSLYSGATSALTYPTDETSLGSELDIFTEYEFISGLKVNLIASVFKPGQVFTKSVDRGTANLAGLGSDIYSLLSQIEVRF